jgi:DHA1 family multidrug resistance protein-like MFS transporter
VRDRTFLALCVLILVNQLGFGIITPVLPAFARGFGLDAGAVGLVIGSYGLARFVANVPAGHLAERHGRRAVLILGTAMTSVASALIATATNLPQLLGYRLLAGLGAATVLTAGQTMVGDIATPANRGRMMSTYQGFFLVGVSLGPTPGGLLADAWGLRAPFVAYAVFSAAACVIAAVLIRETKPAAAAAPSAAADGGPAPSATLAAVVWSAPFLLVGALSFVQFLARTGALFTLVPLMASEERGLSAAQIGFGLTLTWMINIAVLYHAGTLSDRLGRKRVIVPSTLVSGLAVALFAVSGGYPLFLLSAVVWGLGSGLSGPSPTAYVADLAPAALRARVFGLYRSVSDAGYIVGPLVLGWLAQVSGYSAPLLLTAALFLAAGTLFALLAPELHRPAPARSMEPAGEPTAR